MYLGWLVDFFLGGCDRSGSQKRQSCEGMSQTASHAQWSWALQGVDAELKRIIKTSLGGLSLEELAVMSGMRARDRQKIKVCLDIRGQDALMTPGRKDHHSPLRLVPGRKNPGGRRVAGTLSGLGSGAALNTVFVVSAYLGRAGTGGHSRGGSAQFVWGDLSGLFVIPGSRLSTISFDIKNETKEPLSACIFSLQLLFVLFSTIL